MADKLEDVLNKIVNIQKFSDLDGWSVPLANALGNLIHHIIVKEKSNKTTTSVMLAWDSMPVAHKLTLEEHFGRKNIIHLAVLLTTTVGNNVIALPMPNADDMIDLLKTIQEKLKEDIDEAEK